MKNNKPSDTQLSCSIVILIVTGLLLLSLWFLFIQFNIEIPEPFPAYPNSTIFVTNPLSNTIFTSQGCDSAFTAEKQETFFTKDDVKHLYKFYQKAAAKNGLDEIQTDSGDITHQNIKCFENYKGQRQVPTTKLVILEQIKDRYAISQNFPDVPSDVNVVVILRGFYNWD